jgi:hypothetical protein
VTAARIGRRLAICAIGASVPLVPAQAAEIIGPYTIVATPIAASLVSGGGPSFNWLNIANTPVSVNDAFTGFGVIDDGYANAASGSTLLLTFAPGTLVNQSGPDLVLFDADDNLNVYLVSTSADGFSHPIAASATASTGVTRNYFLGGTGPSSYGVFATTIDLSAFGIPAEQAVNQVQIFTEGPSNDPLGLGVLAPSTQVPVGSTWVALTTGLLTAAGWLLHRRRRTRTVR